MGLLRRWCKQKPRRPDPRALDAWEYLQDARRSRPQTERVVARIRHEVEGVNGLEALFDRAFGGRK